MNNHGNQQSQSSICDSSRTKAKQISLNKTKFAGRQTETMQLDRKKTETNKKQKQTEGERGDK